MGNEYQKSLKVLFKKLESEQGARIETRRKGWMIYPPDTSRSAGHDPQDSIRSQSMGQHAFRTETLRIHRLTQ